MITTSPIPGYYVIDRGEERLPGREPVTIPAGTRLTRCFALAEQDGWEHGSLYRTAGGKEIAVEFPDDEIAAACE